MPRNIRKIEVTTQDCVIRHREKITDNVEQFGGLRGRERRRTVNREKTEARGTKRIIEIKTQKLERLTLGKKNHVDKQSIASNHTDTSTTTTTIDAMHGIWQVTN